MKSGLDKFCSGRSSSCRSVMANPPAIHMIYILLTDRAAVCHRVSVS